MKSVIIDGVEYIPKTKAPIEEDKKETPKEEFTWTDELVNELMRQYYNWAYDGFKNNKDSGFGIIEKFKQSVQSKQSKLATPTNTKGYETGGEGVFTFDDKLNHEIKVEYDGLNKIINTVNETGKEEKQIHFSKDVSDFIQMSFNLAWDKWYWTEFFFKKVGDNIYELCSANDLPNHVKNLVRPKIYTQSDMDKAIEDAFVAARELVAATSSDPRKSSIKLVNKYLTSQDYLNSLKNKTLKPNN